MLFRSVCKNLASIDGFECSRFPFFSHISTLLCCFRRTGPACVHDCWTRWNGCTRSSSGRQWHGTYVHNPHTAQQCTELNGTELNWTEPNRTDLTWPDYCDLHTLPPLCLLYTALACVSHSFVWLISHSLISSLPFSLHTTLPIRLVHVSLFLSVTLFLPSPSYQVRRVAYGNIQGQQQYVMANGGQVSAGAHRGQGQQVRSSLSNDRRGGWNNIRCTVILARHTSSTTVK